MNNTSRQVPKNYPCVANAQSVHVVARAFGLALVCFFMMASAATQSKDEDKQPTIHVQKTWREPAREDCGLAVKDILVRHGRVPFEATVVVDLTLHADKPVPMELFDSIYAQWAARHCIKGIAILRAEAPPGATGIDTVVAQGFDLPKSD